MTYNGGSKTVATWVVRQPATKRKAKNVLFFIGDGTPSLFCLLIGILILNAGIHFIRHDPAHDHGRTSDRAQVYQRKVSDSDANGPDGSSWTVRLVLFSIRIIVLNEL